MPNRKKKTKGQSQKQKQSQTNKQSVIVNIGKNKVSKPRSKPQQKQQTMPSVIHIQSPVPYQPPQIKDHFTQFQSQILNLNKQLEGISNRMRGGNLIAQQEGMQGNSEPSPNILPPNVEQTPLNLAQLREKRLSAFGRTQTSLEEYNRRNQAYERESENEALQGNEFTTDRTITPLEQGYENEYESAGGSSKYPLDYNPIPEGYVKTEIAHQAMEFEAKVAREEAEEEGLKKEKLAKEKAQDEGLINNIKDMSTATLETFLKQRQITLPEKPKKGEDKHGRYTNELRDLALKYRHYLPKELPKGRRPKTKGQAEEVEQEFFSEPE